MVLSVAISILFGVTMVTYVVRTWQLIRSERDGSLNGEVIDRLDQLRIQVSLLAERVAESSEAQAGGELGAGS